MHRIFLPIRAIFFLLMIVAASLPAISQTAPAPVEIAASKCWTFPPSEVPLSIGSDSEAVYLATNGGRITALSHEGKMLWSSELGGDISSNLLSTGSGLLVSTTSVSEGTTISNLRYLSRETGITGSSIRLPDADRFFIYQHEANTLIAARNGTVLSVDRLGKINWKREIASSFVAEPYFKGGKLIIAARGKQIFTIDAGTGEIASMRKSEHSVTALGELATGEILVGDDRGNVMPLNGSDKPIWRFRSGGEIATLFHTGQNIIAGSHDNFVYSIYSRNGDVEWKRRLSGRLLQAASIDGRFLLTMSVEENAAVLTSIASGKIAGRIVFADGEFLTAEPTTHNGLILLATNRAVYGYSLDGCDQKKDGGPEKPR